MYVCMYVCMYVYVRMYVCMYVCKHFEWVDQKKLSVYITDVWEGTNSGLDYWNGIPDWTTRMAFLTVLSILMHFTVSVCLFLHQYLTCTCILACAHGVDLATIITNHIS